MSFSKKDSKLHELDIESAVKENLGTLWIDIIEPTVEELNKLQKIFNFHSLTIEDCMEANQRPKISWCKGGSRTR
ncbi:MAG: CorA family divalent cation transporter [Candidatus Heimdallarchaeota archaeon]